MPEIERWIAEQDEPVVLHDPLALLVALGEPHVQIEPRVSRWTRPTARCAKEKAGHEHAVVVSVDAPAAVDRVLGLLRAVVADTGRVDDCARFASRRVEYEQST